MAEVFDPLKAGKALEEAREAPRKRTRRQVAEPVPEALTAPRSPRESQSAPDLRPVKQRAVETTAPLKDPIREDFRVFLTLLWRHLLGCDPNPIQLDMAYWLQHGPDRSIIMAFRGFAKSWITGAYALWRLYRNPDEKILVVSGSLTRAAATTNWCLSLIHDWPLLHHLQPKRDQRQSSKAFDVGPAKPDQSPSFHALGIGGQIVGFRGDCIIADDVETQTNSLTVTMREKIREAVKEFDSVLKPPILDENGRIDLNVPQPTIKFLGTPHDEDSLYNELVKRGYTARIWPAQYPDKNQIKKYGDKLAPYILHQLRKDPELVGRSTMPQRFTDEDLAKRRLSLGNSEYALQFMLDTSLSDKDKYPLKLKDLMVLPLDPRRGPETVVWSNDPKHRLMDLPAVGFDGDYYHSAIVPDGTRYVPFNRVIGSVDNSGRGSDETALNIFAELYGVIYHVFTWASTAGFDPPTLKAIADACVRFRVQKLRVEANFGDGMFTALLRPVLEKAWRVHNAQQRRVDAKHEDGGTEIEEVRVTNQTSKERRILSILEPITQQHRLVVCRSVIEADHKLMLSKEGEDTRHRYSLFHQYTHLTRERDSLIHDDRLDSMALGLADFADILGVDPEGLAQQAGVDREDEEWEKIFGDTEDDEFGLPSTVLRGQDRAESFKPQKR